MYVCMYVFQGTLKTSGLTCKEQKEQKWPKYRLFGTPDNSFYSEGRDIVLYM